MGVRVRDLSRDDCEVRVEEVRLVREDADESRLRRGRRPGSAAGPPAAAAEEPRGREDLFRGNSLATFMR